jgi:hypothetical protein
MLIWVYCFILKVLLSYIGSAAVCFFAGMAAVSGKCIFRQATETGMSGRKHKPQSVIRSHIALSILCIHAFSLPDDRLE